MTKPTRPVFSFELKLAAVQRCRVGEPNIALANELGLSTSLLLEKWARQYRTEGEEGLRPKPKGQSEDEFGDEMNPEPEVERLRRENERQRVEGASPGKANALR